MIGFTELPWLLTTGFILVGIGLYWAMGRLG